jgi:hypothetical protein
VLNEAISEEYFIKHFQKNYQVQLTYTKWHKLNIFENAWNYIYDIKTIY